MTEISPIYKIKIQDAKEVTCVRKAYNLDLLAIGCLNIPEIILVTLLVRPNESDKWLDKLRGHCKGISCLNYYERKHLLISGGYDCNIIVWNLLDRQKLVKFEAHKHYIGSIQIESNGEFFYTISRDNTIREWNTKTGEPSECFEKYFTNTCRFSFTLTPCEKFIAAANFEKNYKVDMFNILTKKLFCDFDDIKQKDQFLNRSKNNKSQK